MPPLVAAFISLAGIESDSDLAEYFVTAAEVAEESLQRQWPASAGAALELAWREAGHRAQRARASIQFATESQPGTASTGGLARPAEEAVASQLLAVALPPKPLQPAAFSSEGLPEHVTDNSLVRKDAETQLRDLDGLQQLWLRAGPKGLHWKPGSPGELRVRWVYLVRAGQRLTRATISKHVKAWRSWEEWMRSRKGEQQLFDPDPVDVAQFLDFEAARGPTLGRARLQSLRWLRVRIGINFPVEDVMLADFAHFPPQYAPKPAEVMTPAMFVNLIGLIHRVGQARAQEPLIVLFFALACVRHKHLAISKLTGNTENFIFGHCPQGQGEETRNQASLRMGCAMSFLLAACVRLPHGGLGANGHTCLCSASTQQG